MASIKNRNTFRASNIPTKTTIEQLKEVISRELTPEENATIGIEITLTASCTNNGVTQTAIIKFKPETPAFLTGGGLERGYQIEVGDTDVEIDQDFYGLTQLYPTTGGKIAMDIVAVTGLNGHAYGSWMGGTRGRMWLRDFLCKEEGLGNCRTMIFGYNSKFRAKSIHTIRDYCRDLLLQLKKARRSQEETERPIIFIGHSFGGILIAQSLVRARASDEDLAAQSLVRATYGVLFFGVPHRGLFIDDVINMVEAESQHQRIPLLKEINKTSEFITSELESFINLAARLKILSFYETAQTRQVMKGVDGNYARSGDFTNIVNENSALLYLPATIEERIPVEGDHSNMVKFTTQTDPTYETVRDYLRDWAGSAPDVISQRRKRDVSEADKNTQNRKSKEALDSFVQAVFPNRKFKDIASQALVLAADIGFIPGVQLLLEGRIDPNFREQTIRHYRRSDPWGQAASPGSGNLQRIEEISIRSGETALARAAKRGHQWVTHELLSNGADPTLGAVDGRTPLHEASCGGYTGIMKLLLECGADPHAKDKLWQSTPLHEAARNGHDAAVVMLLKKEVDANARSLYNGNTPLHVAARGGHDKVVSALLEHDAIPIARNTSGRTAMHEAAREGHEAVIRRLLGRECDLETCDNRGSTALHEAALGGHSTVVWLLLMKNANPQARLKSGKTVMDLAREGGNNTVMKLLYGAILEHDVELAY